jgi:hypothetical protein
MAGIENLKAIVVAACDAVCAVDKLANHEGLFSLFQYVEDFSRLGQVNLVEVKTEIQDLDAHERQELLSLAKAKLTLHNPQLEGKLEAGVDLLNVSVDLGLDAYRLILQMVNVFTQVKNLVGG